ncbi:cysteine desulfurase family protein [Deinococcus radiopugnans]|uniref:cysteine desulfurase n=2 Tax=Deinococcus radiopugnans TaxID=57497 RepID=A0A5C4Y7T5_9DEIO|nr:cysteine desulfurase family protein [Deinococcus radiopugnans]MBB6017426.1 cysteine desulfurase [Deinococcus radiopugnans ATCC 19172]TNM71962.1 cysteine desulfurase [Deinococcus radiopugnans ATCC 19172]
MTVYLDDHATTPCDPRVVDAMLPYFTGQFANPSSTTHLPGRRAADAVEGAREQVAELLNAPPSDVVFTASATESNNLALYGVTRAAVQGHRRRIITLPTEHKAVLEPCRDLAGQGFEVVYAPVDRYGLVVLDALDELLTPETLLVSMQAANSEIGTVQPVAEVAERVRAAGALLHCDATQAVGRLPLDWRALPIDLLSLSGHKLYGPKGSGALLVRRALRRGGLTPLMRGGGQEGGLRPGTHNVPAIVGLGVAADLMRQQGDSDARRVQAMRDRFESALRSCLPAARLNGHPTQRLPGNSSVTLPGVEADALLLNLPEYALSLGSACNSGALEPSYVLTAIGLSREDADATFRVGLGRFTQEEDLSRLVRDLALVHARLASYAPPT